MALLEPCEPDRLEHARNPVLCLAPIDLGDPETEGHVLEDSHMRPHGVVLEYHAHATQLGRNDPRWRREKPAVDMNGAPVRREEACKRAQHCRLAAARGPQEGHELLLGNVEIDILQGGETAETLVEISYLDERHGRLRAHHHRTGAWASAATPPGPDRRLTIMLKVRITPMVKTANAETTSSCPRSLSR